MQNKQDLLLTIVMVLAIIGLVLCIVVAFIRIQNDSPKCHCECIKVSEAAETNTPTNNTVSPPEETVEIKEVIKEVPVVVTKREPVNEYYEAYCEASKLLKGHASMPDEEWMDVTQANVETMEQAKGYYDALQNFREVSSIARVDGYEQGMYDILNNNGEIGLDGNDFIDRRCACDGIATKGSLKEFEE